MNRRNFIKSMVSYGAPSLIGIIFQYKPAVAQSKVDLGASGESTEQTDMLVNRTSYHTELLMEHENKFNYVMEQNVDILRRVDWLEERVRQTGGIDMDKGSV
jgi:hypothetical protein